jgi:hypothetical protein
MRNDVNTPPADLDEIEPPPVKVVSQTPVHMTPGKLKADVTLFDHPDMSASGAGNFLGLAIVGLMIAAVAVLLFVVFIK